MATLQACILCPETVTGAESFVVITFFGHRNLLLCLGHCLFPCGIWVANLTGLHILRKISCAVLLNTCGYTWGKIFQHLPILFDIGYQGLLAWETPLLSKVKTDCSLLF
jgi:hypothetical protein